MMTVVPGRHGGTPARHAPKHPHHAAPARKKRRGGWIAVVVALLAAGGAWWFTAGSDSDGLTPEELLLKQMRDAAGGSAPAIHALGGELKAVYGERGLRVEAKGLPSKACVSAAWRLAREGVVTVNGTTPVRISAAILTELCAEDPDGATIAWSPRDESR